MPFIRGLDHVQIAIPADGEPQAREFYVHQLGLREIDKPENLKKNGGFWLQAGDHQLHIGLDKDFHPATKAHPAFEIDDLETYRASIEARGVEPVDGEPLPGADRFYVYDPFENRIEFLQWRDHRSM